MAGDTLPAVIPPAYAHQREGYLRTLRGAEANPDAFALLMDMGTGKSRVVTRVWWRRVLKEQVDDLLIVAPKGCYMNWSRVSDEEPGEFEKWFTPEEYAHLYIMPWVSGAGKLMTERLGWFLNYRGGRRRVLLMNVEALSQDGSARKFMEEYLSSRRVMFVVDEATCIMHHDSARTKFVHRVSRLATHRMIATGLVAPEEPLNVFSQFWFLDPRILGFRDYYAFRARYAVLEKVDFRPIDAREAQEKRPRHECVLYYHRQTAKSWQASRTRDSDPFWLPKKGANRKSPRPGGCYEFSISRWLAEDVELAPRDGKRGVEVVVNYKNLDELTAKIASASYRVEMDDVLDLPPAVYMPIRWVEMTDEQARMYDEMLRLATTVLEDQYVSASTKLDQLGKLQALLCGHAKTEEGEVIDVPQKRVDAVLEVLQDHSGKVIIWAPYPRLLGKIHAALSREYGSKSVMSFWGDTKDADREEAKRRIQRDDTARFIVANQSVGGEGNTWTAATLTIFAANGPKNKDRQQSERRTRRSGQTKTCTYVDLAVRGTIDEKWVQVIRKKMDVAASLTGDKIRKWLV